MNDDTPPRGNAKWDLVSVGETAKRIETKVDTLSRRATILEIAVLGAIILALFAIYDGHRERVAHASEIGARP